MIHHETWYREAGAEEEIILLREKLIQNPHDPMLMQQMQRTLNRLPSLPSLYEIMEDRVIKGDFRSGAQALLWKSWEESDPSWYEIPRIPYEALKNTPEGFLPKVNVVRTYQKLVAETPDVHWTDRTSEVGYIVGGPEGDEHLATPHRYLSNPPPKAVVEEWSVLQLVDYLRADPRWKKGVTGFEWHTRSSEYGGYEEAYETRYLRQWASYFKFEDRILEWTGLGEATVSY